MKSASPACQAWWSCACRFQGELKQAAGDDEIVLRIESGDAQVLGQRWQNSLLLAADMDPFALVERAVAAAAAMSGAHAAGSALWHRFLTPWLTRRVAACSCLMQHAAGCHGTLPCTRLHCLAGGARPLREKQLPGLLDVFGWCTWDAFYSRVSARGEASLASLLPSCYPPAQKDVCVKRHTAPGRVSLLYQRFHWLPTWKQLPTEIFALLALQGCMRGCGA